MITIKIRILKYLEDKDWIDKEELCSQVGYLASCYSDTVSRKLRELVHEGKVTKSIYEGKRGSQYKLSESTPNAFKPQKSIYDTAREIKASKEQNLQFNI